MKSPQISIIIIVKNDPGVSIALDTLSRQTEAPSFETIVVDASNGALDAIRQHYPDVRWANYESTRDGVSIAAQRNVGIKIAQGSVIVFLDASCRGQAHWLRDLTAPLISGKEAIAVGPVTPTDPKVYNNLAAPSGITYLEDAPTANFAITRSALSAVGEFDEHFRYGSDVDFCWRARDLGYKIFRVQEAGVTHDWGDLQEQCARECRYGSARVMLYRKHPNRRRGLMRREPALFAYALFIIGLPLTLFVHWYPLILILPILKNAGTTAGTRGVLLKLFYGWGVLMTVLNPGKK